MDQPFNIKYIYFSGLLNLPTVQIIWLHKLVSISSPLAISMDQLVISRCIIFGLLNLPTVQAVWLGKLVSISSQLVISVEHHTEGDFA